MISKQAVEEQLKRIGCNFRFWGRSEVNELGRILMEDEVIAQCVNGEYANGFAMLVATNHRLLLVDKKPLLYLTVEDYRYELINEFNFNHRMMNATANIYTGSKTMSFTSWNQHRLRKLIEYVQARVLEMRQQQHMAQQFTAAAAAQMMQLSAQLQAGAAGQYGQQSMPAYQAPQTLPQPAAPRPLNAPASVGSSPGDDADSPQQRLARRIASGRAALGTYTRSKLPNLRRREAQAGQQQEQPSESEGYQGGYGPQPGLGSLRLPYEYES